MKSNGNCILSIHEIVGGGSSDWLGAGAKALGFLNAGVSGGRMGGRAGPAL